jgi:hypothetical protein
MTRPTTPMLPSRNDAWAIPFSWCRIVELVGCIRGRASPDLGRISLLRIWVPPRLAGSTGELTL